MLVTEPLVAPGEPRAASSDSLLIVDPSSPFGKVVGAESRHSLISDDADETLKGASDIPHVLRGAILRSHLYIVVVLLDQPPRVEAFAQSAVNRV
jgi:hypothetical protein